MALYLFPLEKGKTWVSVGTTRNAMFYGIPYAGKDTYEVSVEDTGELLLPDLTFEQAMMVRTTVKVEPAVKVELGVELGVEGKEQSQAEIDKRCLLSPLRICAARPSSILSGARRHVFR